jgi:hypothetical protein
VIETGTGIGIEGGTGIEKEIEIGTGICAGTPRVGIS